jgi:hypothetical protein
MPLVKRSQPAWRLFAPGSSTSTRINNNNGGLDEAFDPADHPSEEIAHRSPGTSPRTTGGVALLVSVLTVKRRASRERLHIRPAQGFRRLQRSGTRGRGVQRRLSGVFRLRPPDGQSVLVGRTEWLGRPARTDFENNARSDADSNCVRRQRG